VEPLSMDTFTNMQAYIMGWLIPVFNLFGNNRYIVALIILLLTISIAWLLSKVVLKYLHRLLAKTKTPLDEDILEQLRRPLFVTIVLTGIDITADILIGNGHVLRFLDSFFMTLLILVWTLFFFRLTRVVLIRISYKEKGIVTAHTLPLLQI
jgi:MscS family membrane protein